MSNSPIYEEFKKKVGKTSVRTVIQVIEIKQLLSTGATPTEIAKSMNINRSTVYNISYRRTWKHILLDD